MTPDYRAILKQYWGYDDFRDLQEDIIRSVVSGRDTLGLMPTGGGKSITFQVPALAMEGICIVVTPLIALMKDQVSNLRARGIKAVAVYSGMTKQEILIALENCIFGDYKFLYISPERLDTDLFRTKLRKMKVNLLTVDESHCISQWGYDFRPSYLKIADVRKQLPRVPVLALTATATPEVVKDIQQRLHFEQENVFSMSFERSNVAYVVRETQDKLGELEHIMRRMSGSAIVYVRSREKTRIIAEALKTWGHTAEFYHAGLANAAKDLKQKRWQTGESRVMVATNAFGMGIDKSDVRLVVHMDMPDSPEAYFQEAGRAGRDGKKAYAILIYKKKDDVTLHQRVTNTFPDKEYIRQVYEHLNFYYQMAMGDGQDCMYEFDLQEFCCKFKHYSLPVDSSLKILTQAGYIEYTDEQDNASRVLFLCRRDELYKYKQKDNALELLINALLRCYTGLFTDYAFIDERLIARQIELTPEQVYEGLKSLSKQRVIHFIPRKKTPYIIYTKARIDLPHLHLSRAVYEDRKERYTTRIQAMLDYVKCTSRCRSSLLLAYFGEKKSRTCGQCDYCLSKTENGISQHVFNRITEQVMELLEQQSQRQAREIVDLLDFPKEQIVQVLRYLADEGKVTMKGEIIEK